MKKLFTFLCLLMIAGLMLTACGQATPTATPAPTAEAVPTEAPQPTALPQPTETPEPAASLTVWHGWIGAEAAALADVTAEFQAANPDVKVELVAIPSAQLQDKFTAEVTDGGGPDLLFAPGDWAGELARANLVMPLDDLAVKMDLYNLKQTVVNAGKFAGQTWAFPQSVDVVVLWYNRDLVPEPPQDAAGLLKLAETAGLGLNIDFRHAAGLLLGAGGSLFNDKLACALNQDAAIANGLAFLAQAKATPNVLVTADQSEIDAAFKAGKIGLAFGPASAATDYAQALGADKLAVTAPLTLQYGSGAGKFAPFLETMAIYLSANSKGGPALDFLKHMAQPQTQAIFAKLGHIPSNPTVQAADPLSAAILVQAQSSSALPNEAEMAAVWAAADAMIAESLAGKAKPADAAAAACVTIDTANGH